MEQEAPQSKTMRDVWDLIIGPEASPWSSLLVHDHLGSGGRLALFWACRGGRDLVVSTAEHATIKVIANLDDDRARLRAITKALVTRGKLPTKLHLTASGSEQLLSLLQPLEAGTTWLDELSVQRARNLPRHALALVARYCPRLRVLDTGASAFELPSCALFPNLKQLHSSHASYRHYRQFCRTAQPYIKQLTHLSVWSSPDLPVLFGSGTVAAHLRTLHLHGAELDDMLLGLLLQGAPALEDLQVSKVHLQSDVHVHTQAQWRKVAFQHLRMRSLGHLPLTPPGLVLAYIEWSPTLDCDVTSMEEAVAARLKDVKFRWECDSHASLLLDSGSAITAHQAPAALRLALALLRSCSQAEDKPPLGTFSGITLRYWTMTAEVMVELQGLPKWKKLDFHPGMAWLPADAQLYATLLRRLPDSYRHVTIPCIDASDEELLGSQGFPLTPQQVESICLGAPVNHTPEAPLRITLQYCRNVQFGALQRMMQLCPSPNVVLEQDQSDEEYSY